MKKVAFKFCGGCDPAYDRVEYWESLKKTAGDRIEWVRLGAPEFDAAIFICGCERTCPENENELGRTPIITITHGNLEPEHFIKILLE